MVDEKVFHGWVYKKRIHGKIAFIDLRTIEEPWEILQVVVKKDQVDEETWKKVEELTRESSIIVKGELVKNERAPGGRELHLKELKVEHIAEPYPLGKTKLTPETEWKYRHLVIRAPTYTKIWIVRSYVLKYFRDWFYEHGYYEVSPPILQPVQCEGGATLFPVKWFDEGEVYLSQSAQLYLEVLIFSLGKVWSLTPSFRAEKSRTRRHLAEYWHLEAEVAWYGNEDMMRDEEDMIKYVIEKLLENEVTRKIIEGKRGDKIKILKKTIEEKWPRIKYEEAISLLQEKGVDIKFGDDLGADEEKILTEMFETPIFVTHYPKEIKAFYMKIDPTDSRVVLNHDCLAPEGYGEIIGGSERETDVKSLIERLEKMGEKIEYYEWYLDLRRYGSVKHSGFGLGIERFLMWVLGLDHIRETLPFPRLPRLRDFPELMRAKREE